MQIIKRDKSIEIEKISNGFLVNIKGRDGCGYFLNEKIFVENLDKVQQLSDQYFKLLLC